MRYLGGKHRQGRRIAEHLNLLHSAESLYVEPFCGALGVARRVSAKRMLLADNCEPLITMWKAVVFDKVELPDEVPEEEYKRIKAIRDPKDWRTAHYGFGLAFAGNYFATYARGKKEGQKSFAQEAKNHTNKTADDIRGKDVAFVHSDYRKLDIPDGSVVYCDPPYANRYVSGARTERFNHEEFWDWVRLLSRRCYVLTTEFVTPPDFTVVHNFGDTVVRHYAAKTKGDGTEEKIVGQGLALDRLALNGGL